MLKANDNFDQSNQKGNRQIFATTEQFYRNDSFKEEKVLLRNHVCSSKNTTAANHGIYKSDLLKLEDLLQRSQQDQKAHEP